MLNDRQSIIKPTTKFVLNSNNDLLLQVLEYYRCLDMTDDTGSDDENEDEDDESRDIYSKDSQQELSYKHTLIIKVFGVTESGHSVTINFTGFRPFFYIKIPDDWDATHCRRLISFLREQVYYKYKNNLVKTQIIMRKPFKEFTGDDKFKFLKLCFINKESFDKFSYKLMNPITVYGLNANKPYKYDLYESNIDPVIKFIHLTKIKSCGWITLPAKKYEIMKNRTTSTNFEVKAKWDQIVPVDKIEMAPINIMSFDIESNSSHGDFPVAIKSYQKLAQELVTLYNEMGIRSKKSKQHYLFDSSTGKVIETLMRLVFNDYYNNYCIHQIHTIENIKPNPETVEQIAYTINMIYEQWKQQEITNDMFIEQVCDLFEYNLPELDTSSEHNSDYCLMSKEVVAQLALLTKNYSQQLCEHPLEIISLMINLPFENYYDAFNVSSIYTKNNIKPNPKIISSIIPDIIKILHECALYTHLKKIPDDVKKEDADKISHDYFINLLVKLFDQYLPPVEGDKLIEIGSTFQILGQPDCYLKHIICLNSCDPITNEEMIAFENKDIYLPAEELASDLVMYEKQLGLYPDVDDNRLKDIIKSKITDIKTWDVTYRKQQCQKATEYRRIKQSLTDHAKVVVECFDNERDILLAWKELIITNDPDKVIGYNIFGFDWKFLYERSKEVGCETEFCQLGRLHNFTELLYEQQLTSAGLGDNKLRYIPMTGRISIDLYKLVQKEYKLDSYKLTDVCHRFLYKEKVDLPPSEIFSLQKGTSTDRKKIATYCLVDCILCNRLLTKLEIVGNNVAMANVCKVPFQYIILRGQGVKIFSLVADYCSDNGYLIPVLPKADLTNEETYEGAIVLKPDTGIHFDPTGVGDFNSLYPSSMISEDISHDRFVTIGGKYDNLPNYTYTNIEYDVFQKVKVEGKKKEIKKKIGVQVCRYAHPMDGKKGILPSILTILLDARKEAKKLMENEKDPFRAKVWNGKQLALKITANSVYGQCGAKTSPINKVEIAASTTAIGRSMIMFSKEYVEREYKDKIVTLDVGCSGIYDPEKKVMNPTKYTDMTIHVKDSYCVYGDTDSVFIKFGMYTLEGVKIEGLDAVHITTALTTKVCKEISSKLKKPQNIEKEKVVDPFILITKKRYHGHYYTKMDNPSFYPNSMGIVLKRRDNAPIVKMIFGGAIDIIMKDRDVNKAREFVISECIKLLKGEFPLEKFIISKTLRSYYKKPKQIAHNVLAMRQAQRDPGNKFEPNDRVPYAFIRTDNSKDLLQGDKIETPEFIKQNKLQINYKMYMINQIIKPVSQIFELVPGYEDTMDILTALADQYDNEQAGNINIANFMTKSKQPAIRKLSQMKRQVIEDDDDDESDIVDTGTDTEEAEGEGESTSNYDNPQF